jgi:hypothetical protein
VANKRANGFIPGFEDLMGPERPEWIGKSFSRRGLKHDIYANMMFDDFGLNAEIDRVEFDQFMRDRVGWDVPRTDDSNAYRVYTGRRQKFRERLNNAACHERMQKRAFYLRIIEPATRWKLVEPHVEMDLTPEFEKSISLIKTKTRKLCKLMQPKLWDDVPIKIKLKAAARYHGFRMQERNAKLLSMYEMDFMNEVEGIVDAEKS